MAIYDTLISPFDGPIVGSLLKGYSTFGEWVVTLVRYGAGWRELTILAAGEGFRMTPAS